MGREYLISSTKYYIIIPCFAFPYKIMTKFGRNPDLTPWVDVLERHRPDLAEDARSLQDDSGIQKRRGVTAEDVRRLQTLPWQAFNELPMGTRTCIMTLRSKNSSEEQFNACLDELASHNDTLIPSLVHFLSGRMVEAKVDGGVEDGWYVEPFHEATISPGSDRMLTLLKDGVRQRVHLRFVATYNWEKACEE